MTNLIDDFKQGNYENFVTKVLGSHQRTELGVKANKAIKTAIDNVDHICITLADVEKGEGVYEKRN